MVLAATLKVVDQPPDTNPDDFFEDMLLEESIAFIGKDCTTKWIKNDGLFRAHDLIKVEVSLPSSINVRVRTAQDTAALCYIGSLIAGGF